MGVARMGRGKGCKNVFMGWYLRKSIRFGPVRLNLSKSGLGLSAGVKGFRVGTGPRGNYVHAGRGGIYFRSSLGSLVGNQNFAPAPSFEEIESGTVLQMNSATSAQLLEEINFKLQKVRLFPITFTGSVLLFLFALIGSCPVGLIILLLIIALLGEATFFL